MRVNSVIIRLYLTDVAVPSVVVTAHIALLVQNFQPMLQQPSDGSML